MPLGNHHGGRAISLALLAGVLALEAVLVMSAGAVGIPGVFLFRFADAARDRNAPRPPVAEVEGGQSVKAKVATAADEPKAAVEAPPPAEAPADAAEPRLDSLSHIPLDVLDRPKPPPAEAENAPADTSANANEKLPWDAVEPVPFSPNAAPAHPPDTTAALPESAANAPAAAPPVPHLPLPANATVETWVRAKATEIKGGDRIRPLYHFEYWLEAPEPVKRRLVAVAYEFNTPAVMPQAQVSSEGKTGFRISAGGLTCADKVTITLKFSDGQSQQVAVDGCRLLG
jgi:hypothetical protein